MSQGLAERSLQTKVMFLAQASLLAVQQVQVQLLSSVVSFCDRTLILPLRAS